MSLQGRKQTSVPDLDSTFVGGALPYLGSALCALPLRPPDHPQIEASPHATAHLASQD